MIHQEIILLQTLCKIETRVPLSLIYILLSLLQASELFQNIFFKVSVSNCKTLFLRKYLISLIYWKSTYIVIIKLPLVFSNAQNDILSKSFLQFMMLEYDLIILFYFFFQALIKYIRMQILLSNWEYSIYIGVIQTFYTLSYNCLISSIL